MDPGPCSASTVVRVFWPALLENVEEGERGHAPFESQESRITTINGVDRNLKRGQTTATKTAPLIFDLIHPNKVIKVTLCTPSLRKVSFFTSCFSFSRFSVILVHTCLTRESSFSYLTGFMPNIVYPQI